MVDWRGGPPTGKARVVYRRRMVPAMHEPPVTIAEMLATYRAVAPRCAPGFAYVLRDIMARCAANVREPGEDG
jgi:hypothetical protein